MGNYTITTINQSKLLFKKNSKTEFGQKPVILKHFLLVD